jgi:hypothetical protein
MAVSTDTLRGEFAKIIPIKSQPALAAKVASSMLVIPTYLAMKRYYRKL